MTQADRDRLVALKKAASGAIRQRRAVEELKLSERQVRRLLVKLRRGGDQAILHGLRGRRSNRKMAEEVGIRTFLLCPDRAGGGTPGEGVRYIVNQNTYWPTAMGILAFRHHSLKPGVYQAFAVFVALALAISAAYLLYVFVELPYRV